MKRQAFTAQDIQTETDMGAGRGGDGAFARSVGAAQLDDRQCFAARGRPSMGRLLCQFAVRRRQLAAGGRRFQQAGQAIVEMRHSRQVVQHPLVDAHARGRQRVAASELDQAPTAQRTGGRQRAPMGLVKGRQRQAEGWKRQARILLGSGHRLGKAGIEFDAGTEQQRRAFETRQAKGAA